MGGSTPKPENALDVRKIIAGVVVTVLGGVLLKVASEGIERWTAANPPAHLTPAPTQESELQAAAPPGANSTPIPSPRVFDFAACPSPCDGSNASTSFPEGTQAIHSRWNYANIPPGSQYVRAWTWNLEHKMAERPFYASLFKRPFCALFLHFRPRYVLFPAPAKLCLA